MLMSHASEHLGRRLQVQIASRRRCNCVLKKGEIFSYSAITSHIHTEGKRLAEAGQHSAAFRLPLFCRVIGQQASKAAPRGDSSGRSARRSARRVMVWASGYASTAATTARSSTYDCVTCRSGMPFSNDGVLWHAVLEAERTEHDPSQGDKKIKISGRMARLKMVVGGEAKPIEDERSEPTVPLQAAGGVAVQLAPSCSRR